MAAMTPGGATRWCPQSSAPCAASSASSTASSVGDKRVNVKTFNGLITIRLNKRLCFVNPILITNPPYNTRDTIYWPVQDILDTLLTCLFWFHDMALVLPHTSSFNKFHTMVGFTCTVLKAVLQNQKGIPLCLFPVKNAYCRHCMILKW